jgi:hypothetical protein
VPPPLPTATLSVLPAGGTEDVPLHDLVCDVCGGDARMHPAESWVGQVLLFLDLHRH